MKDYKLVCTGCEERYEKETKNQRCQECGEPLEVEEVKEGKIREGNILRQSSLERYGDFFPYLDIEDKLSLGEGFTPLISSETLAKEYGLKNIYFKNEGENPTWSFKDRGTITGLIRARNLGYKKIGTVSTGNMATSVAAYGARAGMETIVLVKEGMSREKLNPIGIYHPRLIKVDGDYSKLYDESLRVGEEKEIYFINSDSPFRVEGYKTLAFEICEELDFQLPDYIIVPTSAGGNIRGIEKGFREFKNSGLIDRIPRFIGVQASGCSPIYNAFKEDKEEMERVEDPSTLAKAIENPYPPSGHEVLRLIRRNGGRMVAVSDEEIKLAQEKLASIGLFAQFASATSLAAVAKLKEEGFLKDRDSAVCVLTASGLKYTSVLEEHNLEIEACKLEDLNRQI